MSSDYTSRTRLQTIIISPQGNIKHLQPSSLLPPPFLPPSLISLLNDGLWQYLTPTSCFISLCLASQIDGFTSDLLFIRAPRLTSHICNECTLSIEISINMNFNIIIDTVGASSSMAHFDYSEVVLS